MKNVVKILKSLLLFFPDPLLRRSTSVTVTPQFVYPNVQISTLAGPIRTLASRKAYDEPDVEVTNRRKKESDRFHPYTPVRPGAAPGFREPAPGVAAAAAVLGLDLVTKWPFAANTINNGELTIVRSPPSPPQNEPVDFSTKKSKRPRSPCSGDAANRREAAVAVIEDRSSFTSSKELRFSKNLKRLISEICRRKPVQGRIIIDYLKSTWNKVHRESNQGIRSCTAANGQQSQSGGSFSGRGGSNNHNGGNNNNSNNGNNSGGGYGGGSGGGSGSGNGQDGGTGGSGGSGGNGDRYGGGGNGNGHSGGNGNGRGGNSGKQSDTGRPRGSILDMDLDFEDLPTSNSSTAKWFSDHPDINAAKVIDGLLNLKTEFPPPMNGGRPDNLGSDKPPDLASLDHATANLLQMSVPDPSTTFLDIGTDLGGTSLYEDDPFSLEHLLPSNFNINQLDMAQSPNERLPLESSVNLTEKRPMMGNTAVVLPSAPLPPSGNFSDSGHVGGGPVNYTVNAHLSHLEPLPASVLAAGRYIKQEPVIKTEVDVNCHSGYMPRTHNNNHLGMFGNDHHDVSVFEPMHLSSRLSPVSSSMGSMPSPGSPPTSTALYERLPPGLAITALAAASSRPSLSSSGIMGYPSGATSPMSPPVGGGKMKSPSTSSRKKAPVTEVGQEDEELLNIPSLQVRISILQQRVRKAYFSKIVQN